MITQRPCQQGELWAFRAAYAPFADIAACAYTRVKNAFALTHSLTRPLFQKNYLFARAQAAMSAGLTRG